MAGAQLQIRLADKEAALKQLGAIVDRARNPQGLFEAIGMSLVTSTQMRFEAGKAPDGSPWPPSLRVLAQGGKTLVLTARLMRSITYRATSTGVEVGTNVVYAAIHQFGGDVQHAARSAQVHFKRSKKTGKILPGFRKRSKTTEARAVSIGAHSVRMPARPFLGLDDADEREIIATATDWITAEGATL